MLQLEFSEADKHALNHERYHLPIRAYNSGWKHCGSKARVYRIKE